MKNKNNFGISTIELLVTIGIFVMITSSLLLRYSTISSQLSLDRTTQDISLALHETRMYGISVKSSGTGPAPKSFGLHFAKPPVVTEVEGEPNIKSFVLFSQNEENTDPKSNYYDSNEDTDVSTYKINTVDYIKSFCLITNSGELCSDAEGDSVINTLDIIFKRPAPTVVITADGKYPSTVAGAKIVVSSPRGQNRLINVSITGHVSISNE